MPRKTTKSDLDKAIASVKKEVTKQTPEQAISVRIRKLANKTQTLPGFDLHEFLRITKISDQTWRNWLLKGVRQPHEISLDGIRRYLRIDRDCFDDYISGKIDLEQLWQHRNSEKNLRADVDRVVNGFRLLSIEDKLEVLTKLPSLLEAEFLTLKKPQSPKTLELIKLDSHSRVRLRELLKMTLLFKGQSEQDLIEVGADGALIESLYDNADDKYPIESYECLAHLLCVPLQWSNNLPVVDPNTSFKDISELFEAIEFKGWELGSTKSLTPSVT